MPHLDKFKTAKYIFVIGIGGSNLASKAVWQALTLHKKTEKKVFFLESPDEREYKEIEEVIKNEIESLEDVVMIVISKSGKTLETLETFKKTFEIFKEKYESPSQSFDVPKQINGRTLIISTKDSQLWQIAEKQNIERLEWEGDVGGRFSAFTIAHTTVLDILGLDVLAFKDGNSEKAKDGAAHLAKEIFENYKKGVNILDFFIFNSELEDLGKWVRQLLAESIALITPTVSIGPTDLHSMLELYLSGPKNRFTIFIRSLEEIDETVNEKIYENASNAYSEAGLSFMKYEIKKIDEKNIAEFMAFMIATTLALAKLLEIDPFDQPAVENYKNSIHNS